MARRRRRAALPRTAFVAALLAAVLCAPGSPLAAEARALRVSASPAALVLGKDEGATLSVQGPADLAPPLLSTNVGVVEELKQTGPGRFTARYRAPTKRHPQVALISALGEGAFGFVALPLFGQGEAVIHTTAGARIDSVRIGEQSFGPAVADGKGVALVPVVVPPGVGKAFHGTKAIDLGLPDAVHLHVALDRSFAPADQAAVVNVWLVAVTPEGAPRPDPHFALSASQGSVRLVGAAAGGVQRAEWQLPAGPAQGAELSARLEDEPSLSRVAAVTRAAGKAVRFLVECDRERVVAGDGPLAVRVRVLDVAGNPTRGEVARVEASLGEVEPLREAGEIWVTKVHLPSSFAGRKELDLRAVSSTGAVLGRTSVALVALEPSVTLSPPDASATADGKSQLTLTVQASDRFGNPATEPPQVATALGAGTELRLVKPGEWALDYRSPVRTEPGTDTVTVRLGTHEAKRSIELVVPPRHLEVAAKVGAIGNSTLGGAFLALEAGWRFELRGQPLTVHVEGSWYEYSREDKQESGELLTGRHDFLSGLVSLGWRHPFGQGDHWILGIQLGIGASEAWSTLRLGDQPGTRERGVAFSYEATVGALRTMWHGGAFVELRYWRHTEFGMSNLKGQESVVLLDVGYRYEAW